MTEKTNVITDAIPNAPACLICGEKLQIQLPHTTSAPASWKCRKCKCWWIFNPEKRGCERDN